MSWPADAELVEDQDHADFRSSVRSFLAQHAPTRRVRQLCDDAGRVERSALWRQLCTELGVAGLCVPEEFGGQGAPASYQVVLLEELGRTLAPVPMFASTVLATTALLESGDAEACKRWLPAMVRGERVATMAAGERPHDWDLRSVTTTATCLGGRWRVTGSKPWVVDGDNATLALVLADSADGSVLLAVDLDDEAVRREVSATLDPTRPAVTIHVDDVVADLVGGVGEGRRIVDATMRRAAVALAAEQLGVATRALEMAVEQAKTRVQFGRAIGSFQSLKHLLADCYVEVEGLRASVRHAAQALDDGDPAQATLLAHLCKAVGSDVALDVAGASIQVHGGIGFTWEHDAHLYFKRATVSRQWLGTPAYHRDKVAALMLGATA
ncbi:acyl-CoA dehydrogenase family protein [Mumia sp. Pv 4-285]|uniref:acyl-CoA dehydrogenase family protein n=1 Tax=Mumia qirimensis TaxID=3234852 RepID=UPI00351CC737